MSHHSIKSAIEVQAENLLENWLSKGWNDRSDYDEIESDGNDSTASLHLPYGDLITLADEHFEPTVTIGSAYEKSGSLLRMIEEAASVQILWYAVDLTRGFAKTLNESVEDLETGYENRGWKLVSVSEKDPLGMFAPATVASTRNGEDVYCYRNFEGGINASDVVQLSVGVYGEHGATLTNTYYVRFDRLLEK